MKQGGDIFYGLKNRLINTSPTFLVKLAKKWKMPNVDTMNNDELIVALVKRVGQIIQVKYKPKNNEEFKRIAASVLDEIVPPQNIDQNISKER